MNSKKKRRKTLELEQIFPIVNYPILIFDAKNPGSILCDPYYMELWSLEYVCFICS